MSKHTKVLSLDHEYVMMRELAQQVTRKGSEAESRMASEVKAVLSCGKTAHQ